MPSRPRPEEESSSDDCCSTKSTLTVMLCSIMFMYLSYNWTDSCVYSEDCSGPYCGPFMAFLISMGFAGLFVIWAPAIALGVLFFLFGIVAVVTTPIGFCILTLLSYIMLDGGSM